MLPLAEPLHGNIRASSCYISIFLLCFFSRGEAGVTFPKCHIVYLYTRKKVFAAATVCVYFLNNMPLDVYIYYILKATVTCCLTPCEFKDGKMDESRSTLGYDLIKQLTYGLVVP